MKIEIREQAFNPYTEIEQFLAEGSLRPGSFGANSVFIGTMRDFNEGDTVTAMHLEHYPDMTQQQLEKLAAEATEEFELLNVLILHRVGDIKVNDPIVLVAVWSAHRAAAFDGCRKIMEDLKSKATFWKKETLEIGHRWVEKNT